MSLRSLLISLMHKKTSAHSKKSLIVLTQLWVNYG